MQHNNSNDSRLKNLQPVGNREAVKAVLRPVHSLALQQKNDGKSGLHGVIESDREQITQSQPEVNGHLLSAPIEKFFQRNDGEEAY